MSGLAPIVYEDGRQTRDIVFVEDVERANVLALEDARADGGVFNVTSAPQCPGRFRPIRRVTQRDLPTLQRSRTYAESLLIGAAFARRPLHGA